MGNLTIVDMLILFSSIMVAMMGMLVALVYLHTRRQIEVRHYDQIGQRAKLSDDRAWFETRIADLSERMIASEARWKEANHLVVSGANAAKEGVGIETKLSQFLINLGVIENDLVLDQELIFVLTPFSDDELDNYQTIKQVCSKIGLKSMRGDETFTSGDILIHVIKRLVKARLVIANISSRNPNVFYELGIAHALDKPTILISRAIPPNVESIVM